MPGSIHVSVLDFKELPSSSHSVNISLGKTEYEAEEKKTFSFPLMNLKDNLIITIQDSEGNQVSHSGVRTMAILEKGVWDDVFSIEGGGVIRMKLEFILSDVERNRVRSVRESAMKKKQAEILGSRLSNAENVKSLALSLRRHEVSDILRATSSQDFQRSSLNDDASSKASESYDGIKEETFQRQSFTNATDKKEETPSSHIIEETEQNPNGSGNLVDTLHVHNLDNKIPSDAKKTHEEGTSNKNSEFSLQQAEISKKLLEDSKTRDFLKNKNVVKTIPSYKDQETLDDKSSSVSKKTSKDKKFSSFSQEAEANKIKINEIDLPKRLKDSSSSDAVSEKIKSYSSKLADKMDKRASLEKSPQSIKKMISVFESTLSKDRVPFKSLSTTSNRFGTSRLVRDDTVKDLYEKSDSNFQNSETSSSTRLRNSLSTGDLRKTLSSIITKEDRVESDDSFVESAEINMQSNGNDPNCTVRRRKQAAGDKTMSLFSNYKTEENCHQEKGEEFESSESADIEGAGIEASNGSFGQAIKFALVIGFGVIVLFFRPRETGKGNKENSRARRNIVVMNKRGSVDQQRRRIGVSRLS